MNNIKKMEWKRLRNRKEEGCWAEILEEISFTYYDIILI